MRYICTSIVATLAFVGTSFAATINVPGDHATIQGAISASSDGDTIQIAEGVYYVASFDPTMPPGDGLTNVNPMGKKITIRGTTDTNGNPTTDLRPITTGGKWAGGTVITCNHDETTDTKFEHLIISHAMPIQNSIDDDMRGGGIYCDHSSPTLTNCIFNDNQSAQVGAGMFIVNGSPVLNNCSFSGGVCSTEGAGVSVHGGSPKFNSCFFTDNGHETSGKLNLPTAFGGGLYLGAAMATLTDCTFTNNYATQGGGICIDGSNGPPWDGTTLTQCLFTNNQAGAGGGGLHCEYYSPTLINCTFTGNTAGDGEHPGSAGAISCGFPFGAHLTDCTITGNSAHGNILGGAIIFPNSGSGLAPKYTGLLTRTKVCGNTKTGSDGAPITNPSQVTGYYSHSGSCVMPVCSDCPPPSDGGDLDGDGDVDADDLAQLHAELGICQSDVNHDGVTNIDDLLLLIEGWNSICP